MPLSPDKYYHIRPPLTEELWRRIADADQLVIYSLKDRPPPPHGIPRRSGRQGDIEVPSLHGYPILSQVNIVDSRTIGKVYSSLQAGVAEGSLGLRCFMPHHGVRAIRDQATLDLVICFSCANMLVVDSSGSKRFMVGISIQPMALLNELLEAKSGSRNVGE